jgi:hypothetical protein
MVVVAALHGPSPLTLYRGETLWNRRRRTYGQAWTTDVEVARNVALGPFRSFEGGSVLLKTTASGQAITALAGTARTVSRNIPSIANGLSG